MTYREKLKMEHPEVDTSSYVEMGCPENWGYTPSGCVGFNCTQCWGRLVEDEGKQAANPFTVKVMLDPGAIMPTRAHELDAGYDLYSREDAVIYQNASGTFDTGVHMEIPAGYVGFLKSKSGLNVKSGIQSEGVIDAGYTGSICVKLYNHGAKAVEIKKGQKISQIVLLPIITPELELVDGLEDTERGNGGFGSTGAF